MAFGAGYARGQFLLTYFLRRFLAQETPTMGNRRAPGALSGTAGCFGATGWIRWYDALMAGQMSTSPLLGQNAIARSAWAVIVSEGFTPRFAEMAEPSAMCSPS